MYLLSGNKIFLKWIEYAPWVKTHGYYAGRPDRTFKTESRLIIIVRKKRLQNRGLQMNNHKKIEFLLFEKKKPQNSGLWCD